jgi:hypothetical protein
MKLNNKQIDALVNTIHGKLSKEIEEHNKKIRQENSFEKWFEKFKKTSDYKKTIEFLEVAKKYNLPESFFNSAWSKSENFFKHIYNYSLTGLIKPMIYSSQIRDKIILNSIEFESDTTTIDSFIEKIYNSFKD